jgi:RNA polymerase sigma-70 factor (ECF subfamily)
VTPFPSPLVQPEANRAESGQAQVTDYSWTALCEQIRAGHPEALGEFYRRFQSRRYIFFRHLDVADAEDTFHNCYLKVIRQIKCGDLREPERIEGYIAVIARRLICHQIRARIQGRHCAEETEYLNQPCRAAGPDEALWAAQRRKIILQALNSLPARHREVLVRFYIQEQPSEQIMAEMDLNETQFRLLKSRAKARFGRIGARRSARPLLAFGDTPTRKPPSMQQTSSHLELNTSRHCA